MRKSRELRHKLKGKAKRPSARTAAHRQRQQRRLRDWWRGR